MGIYYEQGGFTMSDRPAHITSPHSLHNMDMVSMDVEGGIYYELIGNLL